MKMAGIFCRLTILWIDLLNDDDEEEYRRRPSRLSEKLASKKFQVVVIDDVQKNPKLLDIVQLEIEKDQRVQFVSIDPY